MVSRPGPEKEAQLSDEGEENLAGRGADLTHGHCQGCGGWWAVGPAVMRNGSCGQSSVEAGVPKAGLGSTWGTHTPHASHGDHKSR